MYILFSSLYVWQFYERKYDPNLKVGQFCWLKADVFLKTKANCFCILTFDIEQKRTKLKKTRTLSTLFQTEYGVFPSISNKSERNWRKPECCQPYSRLSSMVQQQKCIFLWAQREGRCIFLFSDLISLLPNKLLGHSQQKKFHNHKFTLKVIFFKTKTWIQVTKMKLKFKNIFIIYVPF